MMNCPKCGTPEQARVRVCPSCGMAYASQDLLELAQLEFLLKTTASWPETEALRQRYLDRLETLRARLLPPEPTPEEAVTAQPVAAPEPIAPPPAQVEPPAPAAAPAVVAPAPQPEKAIPAAQPAPAPRPKAEAVPFDQWLLSERNIKFALYTGGLLLVIAGLIFVGANWSRMPGPTKCAVLVVITIGMYLGGALLFKRKSLRLGGVALLAVASGFLFLDLAVLQIYVFRERGLDDRVMWLIGSILAVVVYILTANWTRASLFIYLSIAGVASAFTAGMAMLDLPLAAYPLVYFVLAIILLLMARGVRSTRIASLTYQPMLIVAQIAAPLLFLTSFVLWSVPDLVSGMGSPWLALGAMSLGVLFYLITDLVFHWEFARWVTMGALGLTVVCVLVQLDIPITVMCFSLMCLALAYLLLGFILHRRTNQLKQALPFLAGAHVAAPLVFVASLAIWAGIDPNVQMDNPWLALATMSLGVLFYIITDLIFGWISARWAAAIAFYVTSTCVLLELNVPVTAILIALMTLAIAYLFIGSVILRKSGQMTKPMPLLAVAHVVAPAVFVCSFLLWTSPDLIVQAGDPWFALSAMLVAVIFYILTDLLFHWIQARWAAAFALAATIVCILYQLDLMLAANSFTLLVAALAYLLVGWYLRQRTSELRQALPVYAAGYSLAVFATLQVGFAFLEQDLPLLLAQVLIGDVILLAISTALHRQVTWAYGAAWLLIAPVTIYAQVYLPGGYEIGLTLFALMLTYASAGFILGRRTLRLAGAFLSAAAFLSLVVVPLVWTESMAATLILVAIAALYLLFAVWRGWTWPLVPALTALHLSVIPGLDIFFTPASPWDQALTLVYALLGIILLLAGITLRRTNRARWARPLLAFAALDMAGTYLSSLVLGGWLPVVLSADFAILAFWLAWAEDRVFSDAKLGPIPTYLGVIFAFTGHFYALAQVSLALTGLAWTAWPPVTALLCTLLVAASWLFRRGKAGRIYGMPLHRMGLGLLLVPLLWIVLVTNTEAHHSFPPLTGQTTWAFYLIQLLTFAIASCVYFADGAIRRNPILGYLGGGALVVAIWSGLMYFEVSELQAYILPLGLGLVLVGWKEGRLGRLETYRWTTLFGLLLILGSAFYQSMEAQIYAALLMVESLLALGWGIHIHSRGYVIVGGLALVANALMQLGPAFIELPRWVQIGVIGSLLLGGGLFGLFRRDQIITARRHFTEDWRKWRP